ncbi:MAG TPA: glycosyltransferase family 4 protein [Flavisolibacter sp.]|nr:glycosyltransferase family 4 protein [Flavisolibacter sp.]
MGKIKVFLGAYLNSTNAQNLNCLTLAKYINKSKFQIYSLEIYNGNLDRVQIPGVKTFFCFKPFKLSGLIGYLWGIYRCDIAYLPRGNMFRYNMFLLKVLNKRSFKTIENVLDDIVLPSALAVYDTVEDMKKGYMMCSRLFSITEYMKHYNFNKYGIISEERILKVPIDTQKFSNKNKIITSLKQIVFIGNDMIRKGIHDYIFLIQKFPDIKFIIIGSGEGKIDIPAIISQNRLENTAYYRTLDHDKLIKVLEDCDLHVFPSHSEGFGKVVIEAAAAGVPSLLYGDYGANGWIDSWSNGIIVSSKEEMAEAIQKLVEEPLLLQKLSEGALQLQEEFDIEKTVRDYEDVIVELYEEKK